MKASAAALCVGLALVMSACASESIHTYRQIVMGTEAVVTVAGEEASAREAARAAFARMQEIEAVLSDYRPKSEAMRAARIVGEPVQVGEDLLRVLSVAQALGEASGGAFDVTVGPVTLLWREARRSGVAPERAALEDALARVGPHLITLDAEAGTLTFALEGMRLDFGGIGKGYAAAEALATLIAKGHPRALVAIAGDIAAGDPPRGRDAWRIHIDDPIGEGTTLRLRNRCASTSGDREQWILWEGERRSHIIDPRTGLGATAQIQVTVIGPDGATVDALASAASILPIEEALRLVESAPDCEARFVETGREGALRVMISSGWER